ncbi:hypothetical protein [Streptomyces tsukubensis]|uniref:Uncharacterized protein n=1 Tax=Streptomyces tsukubensis TaxID=83656 RepID=A0A1V4A9K1_9ACTN|nr:hypothetical protein [Streptomyces tsukubensis]OON79200.1 hypothetical protein B1H18_14625 [Streptomyces tsukubensis]QFR94686.1 hypothetical protein GBW32_18575 [Streptomyces tsukubensis]
MPRPAHALTPTSPRGTFRLITLTGVVALIATLPLAGAFADPVTADQQRTAAAGSAAEDDKGGRERERGRAQPTGLRYGLMEQRGDRERAAASEARCGPELDAPSGIEAQTCVMTREGATWGRTYYRNATGDRLGAVLSLMAPAGRTVQVRCAVGAGDEPGTCDTPRVPATGPRDDYTAVAEFAAAGAGETSGARGEGGGDAGASNPLLLRSGSSV